MVEIITGDQIAERSYNPALRYFAMPSEVAKSFRNGALDANGNPPERHISDGSGLPCRHCLNDIPTGRAALLLAWQPFAANHAYAETGPVFLCADPCGADRDAAHMPQILASRPQFIARGYDKDERIVDGTGGVVKTADLPMLAARLLNNPAVESVHVRSATNSCFICQIIADDRAARL